VARYAVLGATSWGVTLASLLAARAQVTLIVRTPEEAEQVTAARGLARMPDLRLPEAVTVGPPARAEIASDGLVVAVPAQAVRANVAALAPGWREQPVLSAAKGLELGSGRRMSEVLVEAGWTAPQVAVLSGPNLSHEVARGLPAAAVVAASDAAQAAAWQAALATGAFRVYRSSDVAGVELAGAMKNVIAIAAGAATGLGFGANTIAAILTRGLAEMTRVGLALGARTETFLGLAGVGDLAATCFSEASRNHRFGILLAQGVPPGEAATRIGEAVEGATTAPVALALAARAGVEAPITAAVWAVIEGRSNVGEAMRALLARELTAEAQRG
jgi:glycerol-3-phosphate dehydrogenase (NAD(P)+)